MKAHELRIGNLIERGGQIVTVGWGTIKAASEGMDVGSPIQLNNEWYLKFGFEKSNNSYYIGDYTYGVELIDCDFYFLLYGDQAMIKIKHVHQLQNLYFALTGEELKTI